MKTLFILAGEQSGDHLGEAVAKILNTKASLYGVGGSGMKEAGVSLLYDIDQLSVMGLTDVVKAFPRIYKRFVQARNWILNHNPTAVLLIDYAEFNLHMAKSLRKKGYKGKIIHYVCPSIWAWRKGRAKPMIKNLDLLLSILPFEESFFKDTPLRTVFCGHPLADQHWDDKPERRVTSIPQIGLFPGSRISEIQKNLPIQIEALKSFGSSEALISLARPSLLPLIRKLAPHLEICDDKNKLMTSIDGALATSGTVNLELALHKIPTVTLYKSSKLASFAMLKIFKTTLPFLCLPNIILNREIFPEFFYPEIDPHEVAETLKKVIEKREVVEKGCANLRKQLSSLSPAEKAAEEILKIMDL
jgi:lipid-A-disaccharide synthase